MPRSAARASPPAAPAEPAAPSLPLEARLSFLVHTINARLAQVANRLFRAHDLDLFSSRILVMLLQRREMRVGALAEAMALPQSTISHQLQRLEARKLVRRSRKREDNRAVAVVLTPRGLAVAQECDAVSVAVYAALIERFDAAEIDQFGGLLRRMADTLKDLGERDLGHFSAGRAPGES